MPPPAADAPVLPAIADSDEGFRTALLALQGAAGLGNWLIPDMLIRRIVVTIDNLPRDRVAMKLRPLKPMPGDFIVVPSTVGYAISPANAARYDAVTTLFQSLGDEALVALYFRWYPLFQQAYRELGYPDGKFNNRVVEVLDHLIATPDFSEPAPLLRPKVHYEYFEPAQETASPGRRLLWRIGRDHRHAVIAKMVRLRARIVDAGAPKVAPVAAPTAAAAEAPPAQVPTVPTPDSLVTTSPN